MDNLEPVVEISPEVLAVDSAPLTEEQERIADHAHGPALVFAVAGSGKTHTMVERLRRLVDRKVYQPDRILATSFNTKAVDEIRNRLKVARRYDDIDCRTLHSLGNSILKSAWPHLTNLASEQIQRRIVMKCIIDLKHVYRHQKPWHHGLEMVNVKAFLGWMSRCKGNLEYFDLQRANLPREALDVASQAVAPDGEPWYLPLAQAVSKMLIESKLIQFDDMLLLGWESLVRFPDLRKEWMSRYDAVLVDEFQDLNLAQAEMLHLLAEGHRNYMAIGDDDQTIYEWRGASPRFISSFVDRYQATKYVISDNFRCQAGPLALANAVIRHNVMREPKALSLTKAFHSGLRFIDGADEHSMVSAMIDEMEACALPRGTMAWRDMAVLMRVYSQSALFEIEFERRGIPFAIEDGGVPFFKRQEVLVIQGYLRLLQAERAMNTNHEYGFNNLQLLTKAFDDCVNHPKRYAGPDLRRTVIEAIAKGRKPSDAFADLAAGLPAFRRSTWQELASWIANFASDDSFCAKPGSEIVAAVADRSGYRQVVLDQDSDDEGSDASDMLERLALALRPKNGLDQALGFIDKEQTGAEERSKVDEDRVLMTSIFKAKGREWDLVLLPHLQARYYPHPSNSKVEEERRILYVALTRAKKLLVAGSDHGAKPSFFLGQADMDSVLEGVDTIERQLLRDAAEWSAANTQKFHSSLVDGNFLRYFRGWAIPNDHFDLDRLMEAASRVQALSRHVPMQLDPIWEELDPDRGDGQIFDDLEPFLAGFHRRGSAVAARIEQVPERKPQAPRAAKPFGEGTVVSHPRFGNGVILKSVTQGNSRRISVRFGTEIKDLSLEIAIKSGMTVVS